MGKDEDWRGEHLISAKGENRRKEATRMANIIWHANRRKAKIPAPAAANHSTFVKIAVHRGE